MTTTHGTSRALRATTRVALCLLLLVAAAGGGGQQTRVVAAELSAATVPGSLTTPVSTAAQLTLTAQPRGDGVQLAWTPVLGATGYDVYRSQGASWTRVNTAAVTDTAFRDVDLPAGAPATFTVRVRYSTQDIAARIGSTNGVATATATPVDPLERYRSGLAASCPAPTRTVSTRGELSAALAAARPGDSIWMRDGVYRGTFRLKVRGTPTAPVWLCGGPGAVLDAGSLKKNPALRLDESQDVGLSGFTVRNALQGVMVKHSSRVVVAGLRVESIGYEGIHVYAFSEDVVVHDNHVEDTGLLDVAYGEGIYIGTSDRRWDVVTGGRPDATRNIAVVANTVVDAGAEPIEVKAGAESGVVQGNTTTGHQPASRALGWILVTGNDWLVKDNTGSAAVTNGITLMRQGTDFGHDNVVVGNRGSVDAPGWGVLLQRPGSPAPLGAVVGCDNVLTGAASGLTHTACQD